MTIFSIIFLSILCYADRSILSAAMPQIREEFGLNVEQIGIMVSSFLWSYVLLNYPSSIMLDRIGEKKTGVFAIVVWSGAMVLAFFSTTLPVFLLSRILLGVGEAPTISMANKTITNSIQLRFRPLVTTLFVAGMPLGLAFGASAGAWLAALSGWRAAFLLFGALGFLWLILWIGFYPQKETVDGRTLKRGLFSLKGLQLSRSFWLIAFSLTSLNFSNFFIMLWFPIIVREIFHTNLINSGLYASYFFLLAALVSVIISLVANTFSRKISKYRITLILMLVSSATFLVILPNGVYGFIFLSSLFFGFIMAGVGFVLSHIPDLIGDPASCGSATGIACTISNFVGTFSPILAGYTYTWFGNFNAMFVLCSVFILLGSLALLSLQRSGSSQLEYL